MGKIICEWGYFVKKIFDVERWLEINFDFWDWMGLVCYEVDVKNLLFKEGMFLLVIDKGIFDVVLKGFNGEKVFLEVVGNVCVCWSYMEN